MNKFVFLFTILSLGICNVKGNSLDVATGRETVNLNREWMYKIGDYENAKQPLYDDTSWEPVGLPHSFSIPYFLSKDFYVGYGWYRKHLKMDRADMDKRLFLEFDGVFQEAEIYVNGHLAGSHVGGYTGFSIDFTPYAVEGDNVVAIRVNNLWRPTVAPRGGEHVFSGGIYRNVRLVKKHTVHLDWCGTVITTPSLEMNGGKASDVQVKACVRNTGSKQGAYTLMLVVRDRLGRVVAECSGTEKISAGKCCIYDLKTPEIKFPELWSPYSPSLYTLESKLYAGKRLLDAEEIVFGFRWFKWTADEGFFLNGQHYYFRGANVHQDQAGWGDAVTDAAAYRDVCQMKEAGFDMIRGSHYPHSPAFSDACDREGMLLWSETPFWGTAGPKVDGVWTAGAYPVIAADTAAFEANVLQQLEEMIRIHRNHPSVFVWSLCNEPFFTDGRSLPGVRRLLRRMVDVVHRLDPTRMAAVGGAQRPLGTERIDLIGDVAGYNGDGANIDDFQEPGVSSVVSEYGSVTADRPGKYAPGWGDLARDEGWKGREWRSGQAIWCGFDHGSIFGNDMAKMGIVDYFRLPKRSWYWYRNEYAKVAPPQWPVAGNAARLQLIASKYDKIKIDGTDDVQLTVLVLDADGRELSNSPIVTLRILSGPGEFPTGKSITFAPDSDIRIQDGKAAIALRSYYAGSTLVEASSPGLQPVCITLGFTGTAVYKKGESREVEIRPYVRYVNKSEKDSLQTYGVNNPTFSSSSQEGHSAGLAADGDKDSYWQPSDNDSSPYWMLDTERGLQLYSVVAEFVENVGCCFNVEVSADKIVWQTIGNYDCSSNGVRRVEIVPEQLIKMRFVRFLFTDRQKTATPKLSEVRITGSLPE
ncbi:glycoside hydrolase family 2 protein [Bacteroides sp. AM10-21B]|uniref:glycoside hydrolase family 2 protein n=1 Tax=Bacteroides sp. AM10-21B TaxID=2292001 RepID=UPI000E4F7CFC|nr:glycoside hydrolase family 2 TIM barrel-domain containing protein [Bacteroides sp. AM10-21B]RHJ55191.1 beta-galactosidase [Bacteroides sp. AM10-21B]